MKTITSILLAAACAAADGAPKLPPNPIFAYTFTDEKTLHVAVLDPLGEVHGATWRAK